MSTSSRGALYGISAAAIWGGMYVVSDVVLQTIPPFTLLSMRLILGILSLGLLAWFRRPNAVPSLNSQQRLVMLGIGLLGFGISVGAQFVGTDLSNAVNGSLVTSASPAFIVLFAVLILGERLTWSRTASIAVATLGVIIIVDPSKASFGSETFLGDLALALAAVTWGLYSVLIRLASKNYETSILTFYAFCGGLLITIPASLLELKSRPMGTIDVPIFLGILYLGVISTAVAMWLWNRAFALVEASRVSLYFFAQPLVGAGLGIVVLGQTPSLSVLLGGLLILFGVFISVRYA